MDIVTYNKKPLFAVCACVFFYTYFFNQHAGVKRIAAHSRRQSQPLWYIYYGELLRIVYVCVMQMFGCM